MTERRDVADRQGLETRPALILLVDDDHDFLEMNGRLLESRGYRVVRAASPAAALAAAAHERPDLVITDLMMKDLDSGFTLARQVKGDRRLAGVPVIVVSAVASRLGFDFRPRTAADLSAMAADAFFDKPVAPEALLAAVADLLARVPKGGGP